MYRTSTGLEQHGPETQLEIQDRVNGSEPMPVCGGSLLGRICTHFTRLLLKPHAALRASRSRIDHAPRTPHNWERFSRLIHRERSRALRSGQTFCLIRFEIEDEATAARVIKVLAFRAEERMPEIDEVGWMCDGRLGVLVPYATCASAWKLVDEIYGGLDDLGRLPPCDVYIYPEEESSSATNGHAEVVELSGRGTARDMSPLFVVRTPAWKRAIDVSGALFGIVLTFPLMASIAVAVKLTSPGPMLFPQRRSGVGNRPFVMYKFRTMYVGADEEKKLLRKLSKQDGPAFKMKNDPRITRLGRWLRTTSMDELPQLFNVLKGDMSLVGPRPLPCEESNASERWHRLRLDVVPGMTCIWQVTGRSTVSFAEWVRMDIRYIRTRSLLVDLKLLLKTIPVVLLCKGAC